MMTDAQLLYNYRDISLEEYEALPADERAKAKQVSPRCFRMTLPSPADSPNA